MYFTKISVVNEEYDFGNLDFDIENLSDNLKDIQKKASDQIRKEMDYEDNKNWLNKTIQWLRDLYSKWLVRNQLEGAIGHQNIIKKILVKIMTVIDNLLFKLRNLATFKKNNPEYK